jgi:hypothetical protein
VDSQRLLWCLALGCHGLSAQNLECRFQEYRPVPGVEVQSRSQALTITWQGEHSQQLRAAFGFRQDQPVIQELAARKENGSWRSLGTNLMPEYEVTTGKRRMSEQQLAPLRQLKIPITPELLAKERWNAFWDAPLNVPGFPGTSEDLPRQPEEIRRDAAQYHLTSCSVTSDGARVEVTLSGVSLGLFSGALQYTIYRGSNLLRQEIVAKTETDRVAYKYNGGLQGFIIGPQTRVVWRDVARAWQQYAFGGAANHDSVPLVARHRLAIIEGSGGSLGVFPPPHKFFFAREIEPNLGFVYYRKESDHSFAVGVRQAEHEQPYRPYGVSEEEWTKRVHEARHDIHNFALYNAPPGTLQHMPVYFYLSAEDAPTTAANILAYTHGDVYKEMPGYKVLVSHFHMHFNEQLTDAGTLDQQPSWYSVFRGLGINLVILADFHSDSHPNDPGPLRFPEQKVYFEGCQRFSDQDFLLIPGEEPDAHLGGHYMFVFPQPLFWSRVRTNEQRFQENGSKYGTVYHVGSAVDELHLLQQQNGYMWQTHPRTKGSAGYPDAVRTSAHFQSDRFLGGSYQSLPVDQSQKRLCEERCFGLLDDMNNWTGPKYLIAEGDTYMKYPEDETYPELLVNYVKLPRVPKFTESWAPVWQALRRGDYYASSGEVLLRDWGIEGSGAKRTYTADLEWTFPLEFVELVWGDGKITDRQVISATALPAFGHQQFRLPFDATGKKWIRFAAWDSAGNGAFTQPIHLPGE